MMKNGLLNKMFVKLAVTLFTLPLIILILWSVSGSWPWPDLIPAEWDMRGVTHVLSPESGAIESLWTSVKLSSVVTIASLMASIPAGKALGIYEFKGREAVKILSLAPIIVPSIAVGMGIHSVFIKIGLANTFIGVVLVHMVTTLPYGIRIFTDIFEIIGERLEDQAKVLGASSTQAFIYITLPILAPGLISAGSLMFTVSFSQYLLTFLIGGGSVVTFPMMMIPYIQSGDRAMASAYSLVFIAVTVIVLAIIEKGIKLYYGERDDFYT